MIALYTASEYCYSALAKWYPFSVCRTERRVYELLAVRLFARVWDATVGPVVARGIDRARDSGDRDAMRVQNRATTPELVEAAHLAAGVLIIASFLVVPALVQRIEARDYFTRYTVSEMFTVLLVTTLYPIILQRY